MKSNIAVSRAETLVRVNEEGIYEIEPAMARKLSTNYIRALCETFHQINLEKLKYLRRGAVVHFIFTEGPYRETEMMKVAWNNIKAETSMRIALSPNRL